MVPRNIGLAGGTAERLGRRMRSDRPFGLAAGVVGLRGRAVGDLHLSPNHPRDSKFPTTAQFAAEAQKECGQYGLIAVHDWESVTEFQRVRSFWRCVPR